MLHSLTGDNLIVPVFHRNPLLVDGIDLIEKASDVCTRSKAFAKALRRSAVQFLKAGQDLPES